MNESSNVGDDDDDLRGFIAECEYKTRKILRESNKRTQDNARSVAAKVRVERLKQSGGGVHKSATTTSPPTGISPLKSNTPTPLPVKEWRGRDKIIHDACETIKSFPPSDKTSSKQSYKSHGSIHSSLATSPFNGSKGNVSKQKVAGGTASEGANDEDDDDAKPAMVTLRTIERDLYAMTKKHNSAPSKRHHHLLLPSKKQNNNVEQPVPELKTSVLRKKYRCDERVMLAKKARAVKLYDKFQRLKLPKDYSKILSANDGDDESSSGTTSSDDDDGDTTYSHAIHDLLEKHVAYENALSRKRYEMSQVNKPKVVLSVKDAWSQLEQNGNGKNILNADGQVQSVPLHIATKRFNLNSDEGAIQNDTVDSYSECIANTHEHPVTAYTCPYKKPENVTVHLIVNESFVAGSVNDRIIPPVNISISMTTQRDGAQVWSYEFYEPCNGKSTKFALTDAEFNGMNNALQLSILSKPQQPAITFIDKIVHHQVDQLCGGEYTFVILASLNESGVNVSIYKAGGRRTVDDLESMCKEGNLVIGLQACEVLQLLRLNHFCRALDITFWLSDSNASILWGPLIERFKDNSVISSDVAALLAATKKAHSSMLALRAELDRTTTSGGIEELFDLLQQKSSKFEDLSNDADVDVAPLSARIVGGCSPYSNTIFPGHASVGKRGVWRMTKSFFDNSPDPMPPVWRYPAGKDRSQATSYFKYKSLGGRKGNCVTVLNSMALESPVLAPLCYAEDKGCILPPFSDHEQLSGDIPHIHLPGESLWESPLVSRYDTLLPPPIIVLDPSAAEGDWKDAPTNADGHVYHVREVDIYDNDGFRVKTFADAIEIDSTISCTAFGISETAASPNRPTLSPIVSHKSDEICSESLSRERTAADYHYIAESDGIGTASEPYLFTTYMSAYNSVFVSRKSVSSFRDNENFLLAAKEAERKKMELAHKMKAAEALVEERMKARVSKIEQNVMAQEALLGMSKHPVAESSPIGVVSSTPMSPSDSSPADEGDEIDQLVNSLLRNKNFLKGLARKLSIPEEQLAQFDFDAKAEVSMASNSNAVEEANHKGSIAMTTPSHGLAAAAAPSATKAKSSVRELSRQHHVGDDLVARGEGWNLVPRSEAALGEFSLTKCTIQSGPGRPKFNELQECINFLSVNAVKELPYEPDPSQFEIKPTAIFIPDLTKERLRLAESYRRQKKVKESMLTVSQQQCLDDILQIPVSALSNNKTNTTFVHGAGNVEINRNEDSGLLDHVARAILAVKTDNLPELEQVLNTDGISVDTRDQHGNTLFILACQQGNKKLAKVLLRRGANMNARNNGGNSSLHYLYEYKHLSLAEYLLRKGADDGLKNGVGRTCYEGLGVDEDW